MNTNEDKAAFVNHVFATNTAAEFDILGNAFGIDCPTYVAGALGIHDECLCRDAALLAALEKHLDAPSGLVPAPKIGFAVSRSRWSVFALSAPYLNEVVGEARNAGNPRDAVQTRIFADHLNDDEIGKWAVENLGELVLCDGTSWIRIYWMAVMSAAACNKDVKAPALSVAVMGYLLAQRCLELAPDGAQADADAARRAVETVFDELHATPNGSRLSPGDLQIAVRFLFHQEPT